jgi:hypothetical protein
MIEALFFPHSPSGFGWVSLCKRASRSIGWFACLGFARLRERMGWDGMGWHSMERGGGVQTIRTTHRDGMMGGLFAGGRAGDV